MNEKGSWKNFRMLKLVHEWIWINQRPKVIMIQSLQKVKPHVFGIGKPYPRTQSTKVHQDKYFGKKKKSILILWNSCE